MKEPLQDNVIDKSHSAPKKSAIVLLKEFAGKSKDYWSVEHEDGFNSDYDDDEQNSNSSRASVSSMSATYSSTDQVEQNEDDIGKTILFKVIHAPDEGDRITKFVYLEDIKAEFNKRTNSLINTIAEKRNITKYYNLILYYKYIWLLFFPVPIINILEYFFIERMGPLDSFFENLIIIINNFVTLLFVGDIFFKMIDLSLINLEDLKLTLLEILPVIGGFLMTAILIIRFLVNVKLIGTPNKNINGEFRNILENYNNSKPIDINLFDLQTNASQIGAIQPLYKRHESGFKCNQFEWKLVSWLYKKI